MWSSRSLSCQYYDAVLILLKINLNEVNHLRKKMMDTHPDLEEVFSLTILSFSLSACPHVLLPSVTAPSPHPQSSPCVVIKEAMGQE
jgi:hypothetical protein